MKFFERLFNGSVEKENQDKALAEIENPPKNEPALELESLKKIIERRSTPEETLLESREKSKSTPLGGGVNQTEFIELRDDGSGVFKSKKGENINLREGIEAGTYFKRERAAYLVSRFLGFDLVPPTVIRELDGEIGSFQQFVTDTKNWYEVLDSKKLLLESQLIAMWIFDYIVWNSDRHGGNFLVKEDKIYAIDHGLCFGNAHPYKFQEFFDTPVPKEIIEKLASFASWEEGVDILRDLLEELLEKQEVSACIARIKNITGLLQEKESIHYGALNFFPKEKR